MSDTKRVEMVGGPERIHGRVFVVDVQCNHVEFPTHRMFVHRYTHERGAQFTYQGLQWPVGFS
jgi:hypothetical protein